jgi:glucose/mannose transport system substrate-binding protein
MLELRMDWARQVVAAMALLAACAARADDVEVLHYWRPDESGTVLLKDMLKKQGHAWKDFIVVPGGNNGLLNSLLRTRILSGNPPFAAVIRTPVARYWAREGRLMNLDGVAGAGQWDKALPKAVRDAVKDGDHYIAVPASVYRESWLWLNNRLLKRAGAKPPTDWNSFFEAADSLKRAGIVAVAHGGQQRGNLHLFETVALGVGGPDFFRKAFVLRDPAELSGKTMEEVLRTFRRIKPYTQDHMPQRDWQEVSRDLIENKAAMVFSNDGTKPMFMAAKAQSGFDFACVPAPGTANSFSFMIDAFSLFRLRDADKTRAQREFAAGMMAPAIQVQFNLDQGGLPARDDVDLGRLDACGRQAAAAFRKAEDNNTLVPSIAMSVSARAEVAMAEAVTAFWTDDSMTPKMAMNLLVNAMK